MGIMTGRERVRRIMGGQAADRCGFWLGNPHPDSWPGLHGYFGTSTEAELQALLGDDLTWVCPQFFPGWYTGPEGGDPFAAIVRKTSHGSPGPFADCEDVAEVEAFTWPDPGALNLQPALEALDVAGDLYRAGGFWTCFYHNVMDLFGMESYLVKMYTHPEVVHAVTDQVCRFYYEANARFHAAAGDRLDAFFFGNDFGTQVDLICTPEQFDTFIMPWFRRFTDQAHDHGCQVILHSCGAIHRVIDRLIDAGVDCLHPLQARARGMDAESLARDFGGRIAFLGGIDTQELLVHGTPNEIEDEVRRVRGVLGPRLIVSPSHEALLPNVPPANVEAMARAARERPVES